jgi:hypothetical protein
VMEAPENLHARIIEKPARREAEAVLRPWSRLPSAQEKGPHGGPLCRT